MYTGYTVLKVVDDINKLKDEFELFCLSNKEEKSIYTFISWIIAGSLSYQDTIYINITMCGKGFKLVLDSKTVIPNHFKFIEINDLECVTGVFLSENEYGEPIRQVEFNSNGLAVFDIPTPDEMKRGEYIIGT